MPLIDFNSYRESSPSTRNKWAAALGLQPPYSADVYGHSTPIKFVADKLKEKIGGKKKPAKKEQPQVDESAKPDYSFDRLIDKANKTAKEVDDEVKGGDEEEEKLDKEIEKKKSNKPFPPKKPEGKGIVTTKSDDDDEGDPLNSDDVSEWQQAWAEMEADIEARTSNKGW